MNLVCPKHRTRLVEAGDRLVCEHGHSFPIFEGIPVLLRDDVAHTIGLMKASLAAAAGENRADPFCLDSVGVSADERRLARDLAKRESTIDPVVAVLVAATGGYVYSQLIGNVAQYPIPEIPLEEVRGETLLDIGGSWGRWSISAARKGYAVTGIDPSLGALLAARRVSRKMGLQIDFVCADARSLPFEDNCFENAFSYSVLQHFSKDDARTSLAEVARVLRPGGRCLIQMAHAVGVRSLYHQIRRRFREPESFEVRYWRIGELAGVFRQLFQSHHIGAHCFFGLGVESSDRTVRSPAVRGVAHISDFLCACADRLPALRNVADSLYIEARKAGHPGGPPSAAS